jgi:hypothetical protein
MLIIEYLHFQEVFGFKSQHSEASKALRQSLQADIMIASSYSQSSFNISVYSFDSIIVKLMFSGILTSAPFMSRFVHNFMLYPSSLTTSQE